MLRRAASMTTWRNGCPGHQRSVRRKESHRSRPRARARVPLRKTRRVAEHLRSASAGAARRPMKAGRRTWPRQFSARTSNAARTSATPPCWRRSEPRPGSSERRCRRSARRARAKPCSRAARSVCAASACAPCRTCCLADACWSRVPSTSPPTCTRSTRRCSRSAKRSEGEPKLQADVALMKQAPPFMAAACRRVTLTAACRRPASRTNLRAIVGEQGMLEGAAVRERAATLWHGRVDAELLVRPRSTEQVSAVLRAVSCARPAGGHARRTHRSRQRRRRRMRATSCCHWNP